MTLKQIEAFYWAANLGSFSIAATRLHVTQSSLSKRIAELEESIGTLLFDRSSKKVQLTDAGQRLLAMSGKMLALQEAMRTEVVAVSAHTGTCRFGISELGSLTWLPSFVKLVRRDHPDLVLQPHVDLARNLERGVLRGELDFAVAPGAASSASVEASMITGVAFAWTTAPGRFAKGAVLTLEDLQQHPLITMTEQSGLTRAFEAWAAENGLKPHRNLACNSLMAIVGLTVADMGISFLPLQYIQPWIERGDLVALQSDPPLPHLGYYFLRRHDDERALVQSMKGYVVRAADFSIPAEGASAAASAADHSNTD